MRDNLRGYRTRFEGARTRMLTGPPHEDLLVIATAVQTRTPITPDYDISAGVLLSNNAIRAPISHLNEPPPGLYVAVMMHSCQSPPSNNNATNIAAARPRDAKHSGGHALRWGTETLLVPPPLDPQQPGGLLAGVGIVMQ